MAEVLDPEGPVQATTEDVAKAGSGPRRGVRMLGRDPRLGATAFNYDRGFSRCSRKSISDNQYIGSMSISDDLIFMPQSYLLTSFSIACLAQAGVVGCTRIVSTTFSMSISTLIPCG